MSLLVVEEQVVVLEVEVPVLIEPEQHLLEHIQYQQVFKLVPVALQLRESFPQAFQPQIILETHLILEHQSLHLEEVAVVMMAIMEDLVVLVAVVQVYLHRLPDLERVITSQER
tara:strand:+ start:739 stop:1080 length:342 start_codon:yes stop_codon:yes gene_type:complete